MLVGLLYWRLDNPSLFSAGRNVKTGDRTSTATSYFSEQPAHEAPWPLAISLRTH